MRCDAGTDYLSRNQLHYERDIIYHKTATNPNLDSRKIHRCDASSLRFQESRTRPLAPPQSRGFQSVLFKYVCHSPSADLMPKVAQPIPKTQVAHSVRFAPSPQSTCAPLALTEVALFCRSDKATSRPAIQILGTNPYWMLNTDIILL